MKKAPFSFSVLVSSVLLCQGAFAWTPALDLNGVEEVIDAAFLRSEGLNTVSTLDLTVKAGEFGTPGVVSLFRGNPNCVTNWKSAPVDYAKGGSRPVSLLVSGQADVVFLSASSARDNFDTPDPAALLLEAKKILPDGSLRVYMQMTGLPILKARDAYNVAVKAADGTIVRSFKTNFLTDWKQGDNKLFAGSMVYYFDLSKYPPGPKLDLVVRTEAKSDCVFLLSSDLTGFR